MIRAKSAPKITVQYEGEEGGYDLGEVVFAILALATISRVIFGIHLIDAIKLWWHYIWW